MDARISLDEWRELNRRASQKHEYIDGIAYPREYPVHSLRRLVRVEPGLSAAVRTLEYLWQDAHASERVRYSDRWQAILVDARDWGCDLAAVREASTTLAALMEALTSWEAGTRQLWTAQREDLATGSDPAAGFAPVAESAEDATAAASVATPALVAPSFARSEQARARVALNAATALDAALADSPYVVFQGGVAARLGADTYVFPDVLVSAVAAGVAQRAATAVSPRVVIDILDATESGSGVAARVQAYLLCEALEEYVLVQTSQQAVEQHTRVRPREFRVTAYGPDDELALASVGVRVPVQALYRRTDVPRMLGTEEW